MQSSFRIGIVWGLVGLLQAGVPWAAELPPFDALAEAPVRTQGARSADRLPRHREERLNASNFVRFDSPRPLAGRAATAEPDEAAAIHLGQVGDELGFAPSGIRQAQLRRVHRMPGGGAVAQFQGRADGIEIFREETKLLLDRNRSLVAVAGALLDVEGASGAKGFQLAPEEAIAVALADYRFDPEVSGRLIRLDQVQGEYRFFALPEGVLGATGARLTAAVRVKQVYFRLPDRLIPAWYLELQAADGPEAAADGYAYVVSAEEGRLLFRHSQVAHAYSYRVWAEAGGIHLPYPSMHGRNNEPYPFAEWYWEWVPPYIAPNDISLSSLPFSHSDPWLPAGATYTKGNNVEAFADLVSPDGYSSGDRYAYTSSPGAFHYTYDPFKEPQATSAQTAAAITHLFYLTNFLHDWFYDAGFDEAAGNAQESNYGRGGIEGDSLIVEAQDYGGMDNANTYTPADGGRPRMQMYMFNMPHPDWVNREGGLDTEVASHEWGHYLSSRLIGDGSGLGTNHSLGLGEGWSDFVTLLLKVKAEDALLATNPDFTGRYTIGHYSFAGISLDSYFFGVRRWPYSTDLAKNPLTFRHINSFEPLPEAPDQNYNFIENAEPHNAGEVWAVMLWECYAALLRDDGRLTFAQAQQRMKEYLVAALKLTPINPTLLEARDALLAVALAEDGQDFALFAAAFARRGAGSGATGPTDRYGAKNDGVVESYSLGGYLRLGAPTIVDDLVSCDQDLVLDNGEQGNLRLQVANSGFSALSGVTLTASSTVAGVEFPAGNSRTLAGPLAALATTEVAIPVRIRGMSYDQPLTLSVSATAPGAVNSSPATAAVEVPTQRDERPSTSDDVETLATRWTTDSTNPVLSPWTREEDGLFGRHWLGRDATAPGLIRLTTPALQVASSGSFVLSFRHRYKFESDAADNWDGGIIELSSDGGTVWKNISTYLSTGYNGVINHTSIDAGNPLRGQPGFVGSNSLYPNFNSVRIDFGSRFAGSTVKLRFVVGTDEAAGEEGWSIDQIALEGITNTPFLRRAADANRCGRASVGSGSDQSALLNTAFANPLVATLTDFAGDPAAVGTEVRFSAPASGASGTFAGGATSVLVAGTALGSVTSPAFTANGTGGSYGVAANMVGGTSPAASFLLTNLTEAPNLCSGADLVLMKRIFTSGESVLCTGYDSLKAQGAVEIHSGATVQFYSQFIDLLPGFWAESGAKLNVRPN